MIRERLELIGLRLWSIPYAIWTFVGTIVFCLIMLLGKLILGFPCWLWTGDSMSWVPDWNFPLPTFVDYDSFRNRLEAKQQKFNEKNKKR
jgi:hypothetical protein